ESFAPLPYTSLFRSCWSLPPSRLRLRRRRSLVPFWPFWAGCAVVVFSVSAGADAVASSLALSVVSLLSAAGVSAVSSPLRRRERSEEHTSELQSREK